MNLQCPGCGRHLKVENMRGGMQCPTCGENLPAPVSPASPTLPADFSQPAESAPTSLQSLAPGEVQPARSGIDHEAMTIPQYMAQNQIEGVIDLQGGNDKASASSSLTSEQTRKYSLGRVIARGGMGAILDAKDVNLRRAVAMKVMLEPDKVSKDVILRFIQEAQVTSQLEHPSIVPVHELGVNGNGNVFYTMKLVKGHALSDILHQIREGDAGTIRNYPLAHLLTVFQKICDAMAFAHSKCVIHRDLKPENVMVGDYGEVQVMDWGLAKVLPRKEWCEVGNPQSAGAGASAEKREIGNRQSPAVPGQGSSHLRQGHDGQIGNVVIDSVRRKEDGEFLNTMVGSIMGTPEFMSPEQALGKTDEIDERTDIYALGAILYNILTLVPPVEGKSVDEIIKKVTTGNVKKPTEYNRATTRPAKAGGGNLKPEKKDGQAGLSGSEPSGFPPSPSGLRVAGKSQGSALFSLPHLPDNYVPESLSAVTMKALEVEPDRRYQAVKDLQREIEAYQGGFATKAEKAGVSKQAALFIKRNKTAALGAAAVLIIVLVFGARTTVEGQRAQHALAELGETAPTFAALADSLVENQKFEEAIEKIGFAIKIDGRNADYRLFCAHTLQALSRLPEAAEAYRKVLALRPNDASAKLNLDLCEKLLADNAGNAVLTPPLKSKLLDALLAQKRQADAVPLSRELKRDADTAETGIKLRLKVVMAQPEWNAEKLKLLPDGTFHLDLHGHKVSDLAMLEGLPISSLDISGFSGVDLAPLRRLPLKVLSLRDVSGVTSGCLRGLTLQSLDLSGTGVTDLSMLQGMPLKSLNISRVPVNSLRALQGAPLERLDCGQSRIENFDGLQDSSLTELYAECCLSLCDLSALRDLPLKNLDINGCLRLKDLLPLAGCTSLEAILLPAHLSDIAFLQGLPNLKHLSNLGISAFRGGWDWIPAASDFWKTNGWRLAQQAQMEKTIEKFRQSLIAQGNNPANLPPWEFDANGQLAIEITPAMKLSDISGLWGVAVTKFVGYNSALRDLSPLTGAPLHELILLSPCGVSDLSPLRDAPLEFLHLAMVPVRDISAVRKMPLKTVILRTSVIDVSPLADIPTLEMVVLPHGAKNIESLRRHPKITMISYLWDVNLRRPTLTATEFWKRYDAGTFRR